MHFFADDSYETPAARPGRSGKGLPGAQPGERGGRVASHRLAYADGSDANQPWSQGQRSDQLGAHLIRSRFRISVRAVTRRFADAYGWFD